MACQYWYNGQWRSEKEFKQILNDGLLDQLVSEGKINIEGLVPNETKAQEFKKQGITKAPITVRIVHKIQSRINNMRKPNEPDASPNRNPLDVIKEAVTQGGKPFLFKMVIKVKGELHTGNGKANEKLKAELEESSVGIKEHLTEGIPYMLIPSAYGWYPIRLRAHLLKDSNAIPFVRARLNTIMNSASKDEVYTATKDLEKTLYQTTITKVGDKIVIKRSDAKINKSVSREFDKIEDALAYLGSQLYRVDYTRINNGNYNDMIANNKAVSTDLYSEDGNFFNSSSFVLEAYKISDNDREVLKQVFEFKPSINATIIKENEGTTTNNTNTKTQESAVFNTPINELIPSGNTIVRDFKIPSLQNNSHPIARVVAQVENGKLVVKSVQQVQRQVRKNQSDTFVLGRVHTSGREYQEAVKAFFADKTIIAKQEELAKGNTAFTEEKVIVEPKVEAKPKSVISSALMGLDTETNDDGRQAPPVEEQEDLAMILAQAEEVVPEEPTESNPTIETDEDWDLADDGVVEREQPNIKERSTTVVDATQWDQEKELQWLQDKIGGAYKRQSGKKGTVRVFKTLESLRHYLPKETYEMLLEARKNGKQLQGLFTQAAVLLSQNAEAGTTYHEAFHIVFNLALPLRTRLQIVKESYEKYKDELPLVEVIKNGETSYRLPTYLEVEELLADKFMEYVQAKEKVEDMLPTQLANTFKGMYRMLNVFFRPNSLLKVDTLFENINLGVYKHSIKFKNTTLPNQVRTKLTDTDSKYDNPIEESYAFSYMQSLLDDAVQVYRDNYDTEYKLTEREIISKIGIHKLYSTILTRIKAEQLYHKKNGSPLALKLEKLFNILTNSNGITRDASGKVVIGNDYYQKVNVEFIDPATGDVKTKTMLEFTKASDLLQRFNQKLQERGLYITYNGAKNTKVTKANLEDGSTDTAYNNEEETYEESWMRGHIEINPLESISQRLKSFFATIPQYKVVETKEKDSEGNIVTIIKKVKVINTFGVEEKENPGKIFKYLISQIANSYSVTDMLTKLEALRNTKPYIDTILEKLQQDPILKTELWASVGSKNFATFAFAYEVDGKYTITNSNRKTLDNIIKEELISSFLQPSNPLFNNNDYLDVNNKAAKFFLSEIEAVAKYAKNSDNWKNKDAVLEMFEDISKLLEKHYIYLTPNDLQTIWNPESGAKSWSNVGKVLDSLVAIAKQLEQGKNPFAVLEPTETISEKDKKEGRSLLEKFAKLLQPALEREVVSSFRNIDGKTVYNLILSGFLDKQMSKFTNPEKLKQYLEEIKDDKLINNLPLIKDLANEESGMQRLFQTILLDGLSRKGKKKSVSYADMSDIEIEATSMAFFFNGEASQGKDKRAYYKLPIPSDSPTIAYVQGKRYSREEVIDRLVETAEAEYNRIRKIKTAPKGSPLLRIPNYAKQGSQFQILSFLNGKVNTNKKFNKEQVKEVIINFLNNEFFPKEIETYKRKGIITAVNKETGAITFAEKVIDRRVVKEKEQFFKDYLLNTFYMNTQLSTIFGGDPAFYKNTVDYQKRYKQVLSPGTYSNTENQRTHYKAVVLNDSIVPTDKETVKHITELVNSSKLSEQEKTELITIWTTKGKDNGKDGNNESDAATYITPQRRKETMEGLGRWTPEHEIALQRILDGKESVEDLLLINPPFKPEKPFVFNQRIVDGTVIPTQVKNAEIVLTKSFAEKKNNEGKFMYPKLAAIYRDMQNGMYDTAIFESAVKVGAVGNTVDNKGKVRFSDYTLVGEEYQLADDTEIIELKTEDWRLQQETPPHYVDERGNFGTQLRNLIIADLDLEGDYTISGKTLKGYDVARLYQNLVEEDLRTSFEDVKEMFENPDGSINYEKLSEELRQEVLSRDLGQEYLDALAPIKDALDNTTGTVLPLYHPLIAYKMEAVMNSFFKNRVTKQKIKGGALVNTTSFGVSEHLKLEVDPKTGAITFQCLMPHTSKEFFPTNKEGEVDIEFIKKHAPELLQVIMNRIPTEDKYSMFNVKIVGFTPPAMGGTVILPVEATTFAGLDFDVDKLYFMSRAYSVNKAGIPKVVEYLEDINTEEKAQEVAKNIYRNYKDFKRFVEQTIKGKDTQQRQLEGRRELMDKQIELFNAKKALRLENKEEYDEIYEQIKDLKIKRNQAIALKEQSLIDYINKSIDEAYGFLSEDFIIFDEQAVELSEQQDKAIEYIKTKLLEGTFNPITLNSKTARDNKKIDIVQGILQNKNTATAILNPGNFDSLKEHAARIRLLQAGVSIKGLNREQLINAAEELDNVDFNINYPSTQLELFRRNMTGKQLIGVFANHNTHHAKAQYTNLHLIQPVEFNGKEYQQLNQVLSPDGVRISRMLATDLAAVVDNAKEPLASFLNLNTFTANTIALLQRLGVDERTIFAFMNQPVLVELSQKYFNEQGSLSDTKQFDATRAKWKKALKEKELTEVELTTELLEKHLVNDHSEEFYATQLQVLNTFEDLLGTAGELAQGIQAAKIDTTGVGPSSATNYVLIQKQLVVLEKIKTKTNRIAGLEEIFWGGNSQTMIPAFTKYGLIGPINILNKIFPSIGTIKNDTFTFSVLGKLKNWFASQKPEGTLTEKEANLINNQFINFLASAFPFFNYSQAKDILGRVPDRLLEAKKSIPENAPYRLFLEQLYVVNADSYSPIKRIEYYTTGKTPMETQRIKAAWERMLQDEDPKVKQLAQDLVKYTYFSNGYYFGPYSFANMVPVKFWSDEYQQQEGITDSKGNTFNKFLSLAIDSDKLATREDTWKNRFIDQFIRNHADKEQLIQSVKVDKTLPKPTDEDAKDEAKLNYITTIAAKDSSGGVIRTHKGYLIINRDRNKNLVTNEGPVKYIKVFLGKGKIQVYEHVATKFDNKNPIDFEGKNNMDTLTYKPISNLGVTNFVLEYDYNNNIDNSLLATIKNSPNPAVNTPKKVSSTVVNEDLGNTDEVMSQMLAELESTTLPPVSTTKQLEDTKLPPGLDTKEDDWEEYTEILNNIPLPIRLGLETLSKQEFVSLNAKERKNAIWQLKNC